MSELKLPVKFDEDLDLVDADGFPLLWGADMIDHNPFIGVEIAKRINNYGKLLEALEECRDVMEAFDRAPGATRDEWDFECEVKEIDALLAQLEAGKGGE